MSATDVDREVDRIFREGAGLWNEHKFFEAHDKWEEAWRLVKHEKKVERAKDPRRDLIHGFILYAAAYVHWQRGNRIGVERKLTDARRAFGSTSQDSIAGFRTPPFCIAVERDLERATSEKELLVPGRIPGIRFEDAD